MHKVVGYSPVIYDPKGDFGDAPVYAPALAMSRSFVVAGGKRDGRLDLPAAGDGVILTSWRDVFIDNVFITPSDVEAGVVTAGEVREFEVWHSYGHSLDLEYVLETGDDSVALGGVKQGMLRAFASSPYKVSLGQTTAVDIKYQAAFSFGFAGLHTYNLKGMMALVVAEAIDWNYQPEATHQYLTETIETFNGTEQRISLRDQPRLSLRYSYTIPEEKLYNFENSVMNSSSRMVVPVWPYKCELANGVNVGDQALTLVNVNRQLASSERLLIIENGNYELLDIKSVAGNVVSLVQLVKKNFSSNATVTPAVVTNIADDNGSVNYSNDVATYAITFELDETAITRPAPIDDFARHAGKRILHVRPNRSRDITTEYKKLREHFDPQIGARKITERSTGSVRYLNYSFTLFSEAERQRLEDFVDIHAGAQGEFYAEGPGVAFELQDDVTTASSQITIKAAGYNSFISSNSYAPAIAIKLYNNTTIYRSITNVVRQADGSESVILDQQIEPLKAEDIDYIAPLYLCRFAGDNFSYIFDTTEVSSITKTIKQLLYADPETN